MFGMRAILGGLLGGAVGVALWAAIGYFTGYEVGIVAWVVGLLVGLGAIIGAGGRGGVGLGVAAGAMAIVAIVAGKFTVASLMLREFHNGENGEKICIASIADGIVSEKQEAGVELAWPETDQEAEATFGYPVTVWNDASRQWRAMLPDERRSRAESVHADFESAHNFLLIAAFIGSLSPFDLLWLFLAVGTAFKLAAAGPGQTIESGGITVTTAAVEGSAPGARKPRKGASHTIEPVRHALPMRPSGASAPETEANSRPLSSWYTESDQQSDPPAKRDAA